MAKQIKASLRSRSRRHCEADQGVIAKQIKELKIVGWFNWLPDVDSNHGPND